MIQWIYRWIRGYLHVILKGRRAGRFLNLCAKNGMRLWDVNSKKETDCYQFYMYLRDFRNVRPLCRKTHTKLRVKNRFGFPFFQYKYRKRIVFPVAFLFMVGFIWFCSGYIWKIEIIGNSYLSEDTIIEYLEENNAGFGVSKIKLDCNQLELSLREDFPQVIWASSYTEGTKLVVEIQESIKTEGASETQIGDETDCVDLVATKDAVIASIITRNGNPYVKAGDSITAGSILVSGRQEILDDTGEIKEYFYQSADADVYGYVTYQYEDVIPISVIETKNTGKTQSVYFIEFMGKRLETPKFGKKYKQSECLENYQQLHFLENLYLPIFIGKKQYQEQQNIEKKYTQKEAKEVAEIHLRNFLKDLEENGVSIIDKNVMINKMGDSYRVSGTIQACEKITQKSPTEILEIQKEGTQVNEHE